MVGRAVSRRSHEKILGDCEQSTQDSETNLRNLYLDRALKSINCKNRNMHHLNRICKEQKLEKYSLLRVNILSETWTCELLRCLARDRKSTPKFHYTTWHQATMLMFSQELIWRGEICYTNVVVSGLILKMRSEDTFLEKWCISLPFDSVTLAIKADHEAAEHFVYHRGPSMVIFVW